MKKYKKYFILIIFVMGSQALLYYLTKHFSSGYHIINSIVDIPLVKSFVYVYDSWYPFIILTTFLIYKYDNKIFKYLIMTMLIGALLSQITFIIYPSMIIRPTVEVKNITDWLLNFTYQSDNPPLNCLPSMHCVYCFITAFYIAKSRNINSKCKVLIIMYSLVIVLSTLFIKQHVIEDVLLAFVYTIISLLIVFFSKEKIAKLFSKIDM